MADEGELSDEAVRRVEAIRRRVIAQARKILSRSPTTAGKVGGGAAETLAVLANVRSACVSLIRSAGHDEVVPVADAGVVAAMDAAARESGQAGRGDTRIAVGTAGELGGIRGAVASGPSFSGGAEAAIRAAASGALDHVAEAFDVVAGEVREAVDAAANAPVDLDTFVANVADRMDVAFARAEVAVDAAIRGAWRATTFALAQSGASAFGEMALFLYDNPIDAKTRPFCVEHAGKVYSAAALARLDNGQIGPVSTFLGGYGCRGHLAPITLEDAKAEGYEIVL